MLRVGANPLLRYSITKVGELARLVKIANSGSSLVLQSTMTVTCMLQEDQEVET